jgi:TolA-binding protein
MARTEKPHEPIHHNPNEMDIAAEQSLNFWTRRIHPYIKPAIFALIALVIVTTVLAALHNRRQAREADAYAALDAATTPEAFAKVAADYAGTPAGSEALLSWGRSLFEAGKYADAAARYGDFIRQHPDSKRLFQARIGEAYALEAAGKKAEAEKAFAAMGSTMDPQSPDLAVEALLGAARNAQAQSKTAEAEKWLKQALTCGGSEPFKARVLTALGALPRAK